MNPATANPSPSRDRARMARCWLALVLAPLGYALSCTAQQQTQVAIVPEGTKPGEASSSDIIRWKRPLVESSAPDDSASCVTASAEEEAAARWAVEMTRKMVASRDRFIECFGGSKVENGQRLAAEIRVDAQGRGTMRVVASDPGVCAAAACLKRRTQEVEFPVPPEPVEPPRPVGPVEPGRRGVHWIHLEYLPLTTQGLRIEHGVSDAPFWSRACSDQDLLFEPEKEPWRVSVIDEVLGRHQKALGRCYRHALPHDPMLQGIVVVQLQIRGDGKVEQAATLYNEVRSCRAVACIRNELQSMQFPTAASGGRTLFVPMSARVVHE